ncbi:MAG: histidine kinase N-terminal 7TM domain-containing protein [Candidatus Paceibacterota bacterium]|jgi:hypothetical protein
MLSVYLISACYILTFILNLSLGLFIYLKEKKSRVNKLFFGIAIGIAFWTLSIFLMLVLGPFVSYDFSGRLSFAGSLTALWFFFLFSFQFPKSNINDRTYLIIKNFGSAVTVLFILFTMLTPYIVKNGHVNGTMEISVNFGFLYPFLGVYFLSLMFIGLANLLKNIFSSNYNQIEKNQIRYFFLGAFLTISIGAIPNLILPMFFKIYKFANLGPLGTIFLVLFTALAIARYHLFEIKVIITELLVATMGIVLLCFPFLMSSNFNRVIAVIVFLVFCLIGYLLIKGSLKEIKNSQILEQKVAERTKELAERNEELEKFYKLTIGREARMAELKEKIKEMENKNRV